MRGRGVLGREGNQQGEEQAAEQGCTRLWGAGGSSKGQAASLDPGAHCCCWGASGRITLTGTSL